MSSSSSVSPFSSCISTKVWMCRSTMLSNPQVMCPKMQISARVIHLKRKKEKKEKNCPFQKKEKKKKRERRTMKIKTRTSPRIVHLKKKMEKENRKRKMSKNCANKWKTKLHLSPMGLFSPMKASCLWGFYMTEPFFFFFES